MSTPAEIMDISASLMNDTAQTNYTDAAQLPYLNMALRILQNEYQLNNIPVTNAVSAVIDVTAGETGIGGAGEPALPTGLIEIQSLNERTDGTTDSFIRMVKREFLPLTTEVTSQHRLWAWMGETIDFLESNTNSEMKIDYIVDIFTLPITIGNIAVDLGIINTDSFLGYKTAALCSRFIGENPTRANSLDTEAQMALDRALGIPIKGKQSISTRRRPFMESYRRRGYTTTS